MKRSAALAFVFLAGCATVMHGPNETITVDSRPSGAAASIKCDGVNVSGTTPTRLVIPRKADHCVVEASKAGRTKSLRLVRGYSGRYWANFTGAMAFPIGAIGSLSGDSGPMNTGLKVAVGLTGGGFLVDWLSGSMYDRDVHEVTIDLEN